MSNNFIKAKRMYETGEAFALGASVLEEKSNTQDCVRLNIPAIVNRAFACEVFLKCLLTLEGKENVKEHNLKNLLEQLSDEEKLHIENKLKRSQIPSKDCFGFAYLDKIANAFIKWRYEYESLKMQINTGFLIVLSDIFKNECYDKLLEGEEQIIKEYEQKKI